MKSSPPLALVALLLFSFSLSAISSCKGSSPDAAPAASTMLLPGEICDAQNTAAPKLTFDPPTAIVAPRESRPVRLTIEPDACDPKTVTFMSANAAIATAPADATFDLRHATLDFVVTGSVAGRTTITASLKGNDGTPVLGADGMPLTASLPVDVRERDAPACSAADVIDGTVGASAPILHGNGTLSESYLSVPPAAFGRTDELALPSFGAQIACAVDAKAMPAAPADLTVGAAGVPLRKLGPAVTFTARAPVSMATSLRREIDVAIPVNPAAFPAGARMRHLLVLYTSPKFKKPRAIPVANPRIEPLANGGDGYLLKFQTPWFGTFQAAVAESAGSKTHKRHLTHRAVMGFSMGGGGAAIFGMRHHDKFDIVAPLGGPSDWTWLLWYIEQNALGGFCPAGKTCPQVPPNLYPMNETYAHTMDFEHWFYETGNGNGGHFPRSEYVQIFEDLALSLGNPNGSSSDPALIHVALGPKKDDPFIKGDPSLGLKDGQDCSFTINPIAADPPDDKNGMAAEARQQELETKCAAFRCDPKNAYHADANYFDDEYNPDGTLPVISFCDGNQDPNAKTPYINGWAPGGGTPVNLGLAVDLNKNGVRDQGEPVIRAGHEPYDDCGPDQLCDADEPGYNKDTNPDPNQDDYDYQLNPTGTEGNHRWDDGERYSDFGLDGVPNTAGRHIAGDQGENDGKFTMSVGLANFYANDAHGIISRRVTDVPAGPLTDAALQRIDILSDGGVRDLFNFAAVANHLTGQIFARKGADGLPLKSVAFYNGFHFLPGEPQDKPNGFVPFLIRWADLADMPSIRYGDVDATRAVVERDGDGQHVGTAAQLLYRLETAFFLSAQHWPDADRRLTMGTDQNPATSTINELGIDCEVRLGARCEKIFTGKRSGRTGPIAISLPPGYALQENVARNVRYPVIYVLHGYGQDPRDLEAVAAVMNNFTNDGIKSSATRLAKMIIVYVDGRCRVRADGKPECIRGTFYMNSARADGAKLDDWFDEVIDYVDQNYRTMPPTDIEVED